MIKAVLFDIDGVVIKDGINFSQRFSNEFSVPAEKIQPFFKNEFQLCLVGKADIKVELNKYFKKWGWPKSIDKLLLYWFKNESKTDKRILKNIELLRSKGIKCYLHTNNEKYRVQYLLNEVGLKIYIDGVFYSAQVGYKKPQQEFWSAVYKKIGLSNKNEVIVWDDKQENVESAKEFGFISELYINFDSYEKCMKFLIK